MWNPEFSITESDAILAAKNGTLKALRIVKDGDSCHVLMQLTWRKDQDLYLVTTRNRKEPRRFRDLDRLVEYIKANFPGVTLMALVLQDKPATGPVAVNLKAQ